jgi:dimethylhistidine N-methyltransferase
MENNQFADTILKGLSLERKKLPSWLIYDSRGSEIFNQITKLENYHPARYELEIFNTHKSTISKIFSSTPTQLIELGSGGGEKTMVLIRQLLEDRVELQYTAIDISEGAIDILVKTLNQNFNSSSFSVTGLVADYFEGLASISDNNINRKMVLFLGVTLNNMDIPEAKEFLKRLHESLKNEDYLLIGFDLMKNPKLLHKSYNDELFEKFNLHLLDRINQVLGADFNKKYFVQEGQYNPITRAVESYLYSTRNQTVHIKALNKDYHFKTWEALQTEQSFKYTLEEIENLAFENGFKVVEHLFDSRKYFVDSIWKVAE